jgi:hypothetical protein
MTTRSIGGGSRLARSPKKAWPPSPPFLSESGNHPTQFVPKVVSAWRILAGFLDPELTVIPESG